MALVDWNYGLEKLRKGVVRVVFIKKGNGAVREMWATRNKDLIASYIGISETERLGDDNREQMEKQKLNNNLVVFDLEKESFRTIPLDNIQAVDQFNGVDGWIEFNLNGQWKDIMKGKKTISDYMNYL